MGRNALSNRQIVQMDSDGMNREVKVEIWSDEMLIRTTVKRWRRNSGKEFIEGIESGEKLESI